MGYSCIHYDFPIRLLTEHYWLSPISLPPGYVEASVCDHIWMFLYTLCAYRLCEYIEHHQAKGVVKKVLELLACRYFKYNLGKLT